MRWVIVLLLMVLVNSEYIFTNLSFTGNNSQPMFTGQYYVASDPSAFYDDAAKLYRLYYTCFDPCGAGHGKLMICQAQSINGVSGWSLVGKVAGLCSNVQGVALENNPSGLDQSLETSVVRKDPLKRVSGATYIMLYSGYDNATVPGLGLQGYRASIFLATSEDGNEFKRENGGDPVLKNTPGWYDNDHCYSPTLLFDPLDNNKVHILYVGWCLSNCTHGQYGPQILGATSTDLINWEKWEKPVVSLQDLPSWTSKSGVAEPLVYYNGSTGLYTLFVTGQLDNEGNESSVIGVGMSGALEGPYEWYSEPVIRGVGYPSDPRSISNGGVIAPSYVVQGNVLRMYYILKGYEASAQTYLIGTGTIPLPLVISPSSNTTTVSVTGEETSSAGSLSGVLMRFL